MEIAKCKSQNDQPRLGPETTTIIPAKVSLHFAFFNLHFAI
jgi:hypothetical protein